MSELVFLALLIIWLTAGYAAWLIEIRRIRAWRSMEALDAIMIGPCLIGGPAVLLALWLDRRR